MSSALNIEIDLKNQVPVFHQIADGIRTCIIQGGLIPGDSLPSVRQIGLQLGVHFNTVAQAYRELEKEGWLLVRRKTGTIVLKREGFELNESERQTVEINLSSEIENTISRAYGKGLSSREIVRILRLHMEKNESGSSNL